MKEPKASNQKLAKLTAAQVRSLRSLYEEREKMKRYYSNGNLCKWFDISPVTLNRIVNKKHYKNI